jgi:hypothetical protein
MDEIEEGEDLYKALLTAPKNAVTPLDWYFENLRQFETDVRIAEGRVYLENSLAKLRELEANLGITTSWRPEDDLYQVHTLRFDQRLLLQTGEQIRKLVLASEVESERLLRGPVGRCLLPKKISTAITHHY